MKRVLYAYIIVFLLLPCIAIAELDGISVDQFVANIADDCTLYVEDATTTFDKRTLFSIRAAKSGAAYSVFGYSYPDSSILEFAFSPVYDDKDSMVLASFFMAAMSQKIDAQDRMNESSVWLNADMQGQVKFARRNKWYKKQQIGQYYLEIITTDAYNSELVLCWLHAASEIKFRSTAISMFSDDMYPSAETLYESNAGTSSTQPAEKRESVSLSSGEWECPDHITAGEYRVTATKSATISVWRGDDLIIAEFLSDDEFDEIGRLVLKAGDVIKISGGKLTFAPFK